MPSSTLFLLAQASTAFSGGALGALSHIGWVAKGVLVVLVLFSLVSWAIIIYKGVALLAIYSLGLAVPFLLTSVGINRFLAFYARFRRHLHKLEIASGTLLIVVGVLVFTRHFAVLNSWMNSIPLFRNLAEKFL